MGFVTGASGEAITLGRLLFVFVQVGRWNPRASVGLSPRQLGGAERAAIGDQPSAIV